MNKNFVIIALVALLIALVPAVIYSGTISTNINDKHSHVSALYETDVVTQVKHNGVWLSPVDQGHNIIPNNGLNWTIAKIFGMTSPSGGGTITVIALGNNSNAEVATLSTINTTTLNSPITDCTLTATSVTPVWVGQANVSLSKLWTSTCALVVNTTALYNDTVMSGFGTTTIMFAGKNFTSSVTLASGDQLNVTWYVWVTSG
jgi:hypothetical protein